MHAANEALSHRPEHEGLMTIQIREGKFKKKKKKKKLLALLQAAIPPDNVG